MYARPGQEAVPRPAPLPLAQVPRLVGGGAQFTSLPSYLDTRPLSSLDTVDSLVKEMQVTDITVLQCFQDYNILTMVTRSTSSPAPTSAPSATAWTWTATTRTPSRAASTSSTSEHWAAAVSR